MSLTKEIQIEVEAFVARMTTLISNAALAQFQEAIGASIGVKKSGSSAAKILPKHAAKSARKKGAKRSPDELAGQTAALLAYIKKHPGERIESIAAGLGISTKDLALPVLKLKATKEIKTRGVKRATAYWAR